MIVFFNSKYAANIVKFPITAKLFSFQIDEKSLDLERK